MGIGRASGENRAEDAAKQAIQSPLLETSIEGARGVIINITGGSDIGLHEANTAAELVQRSADPEANIIFGTVTDDSMGDEIQITVIATGFEKEDERRASLDDLVKNRWNERGNTNTMSRTSSISSTPTSSQTSSAGNGDLDLPAFLRNKRK